MRGAIDTSVVTGLGLVARGQKYGSHGVRGRVETDIYDVYLEFPDSLGLSVEANAQSVHALSDTPFRNPQAMRGRILMVIGRDILQHLKLFYDGPNGGYRVVVDE